MPHQHFEGQDPRLEASRAASLLQLDETLRQLAGEQARIALWYVQHDESDVLTAIAGKAELPPGQRLTGLQLRMSALPFCSGWIVRFYKFHAHIASQIGRAEQVSLDRVFYIV